MAMAPPPEPEPDSVFDLIPSPLAAPESCEPPLLAPAPEPPTPKTVHNSAQSAKVGRNDSCPCGSGKKFKRCCLEGWVEKQGLALDDVEHCAETGNRD
jgi:hypothetical protein